MFWLSMAPPTGNPNPPPEVAALIDRDFGSFAEFKRKFSETALGHFGSGWVWLVLNDAGKLEIVSCHDADNPLKKGAGRPIMTCDVWEHAYYIDYRNRRAEYVEKWWNLVNWAFVKANLGL